MRSSINSSATMPGQFAWPERPVSIRSTDLRVKSLRYFRLNPSILWERLSMFDEALRAMAEEVLALFEEETRQGNRNFGQLEVRSEKAIASKVEYSDVASAIKRTYIRALAKEFKLRSPKVDTVGTFLSSHVIPVPPAVGLMVYMDSLIFDLVLTKLEAPPRWALGYPIVPAFTCFQPFSVAAGLQWGVWLPDGSLPADLAGHNARPRAAQRARRLHVTHNPQSVKSISNGGEPRSCIVRIDERALASDKELSVTLSALSNGMNYLKRQFLVKDPSTFHMECEESIHFAVSEVDPLMWAKYLSNAVVFFYNSVFRTELHEFIPYRRALDIVAFGLVPASIDRIWRYRAGLKPVPTYNPVTTSLPPFIVDKFISMLSAAPVAPLFGPLDPATVRSFDNVGTRHSVSDYRFEYLIVQDNGRTDLLIRQGRLSWAIPVVFPPEIDPLPTIIDKIEFPPECFVQGGFDPYSHPLTLTWIA